MESNNHSLIIRARKRQKSKLDQRALLLCHICQQITSIFTKTNIQKQKDTEKYTSIIICGKHMMKTTNALWPRPLIADPTRRILHSLLGISINVLNLVDVYDAEKRIHIYENIRGGTLADFLRNNIQADRKIPHKDVFLIMQKLIDALDFFHSYGVIFKNLKPESIAFTEDGDLSSLKIFNFEFASCKEVEPLLRRNGKYLEGNAGRILTLERIINNTFEDEQNLLSIKYSAPELIMKKDYSENVDMWSLGIIFYLLLTNKHPLEYLTKYCDMKNLNQTAIAKLDCVGPDNFIDFNADFLKTLPESIVNLLSRMLRVNPDERISIKEKSKIMNILSNAFISLEESLINVDNKVKPQASKRKISKCSNEGSFSECTTSISTLDTSIDEVKIISSKTSGVPFSKAKMEIYNRFGFKSFFERCLRRA